MIISGAKSTEVQGLLWERPLRGHVEARNVSGDLAERLTVKLVGGVRHKTAVSPALRLAPVDGAG